MDSILISYLVVNVVLSVVVGYISSQKGRDGVGYFFISVLLSPLIGLIILFVMGDSDKMKFEKIKQEEEMRVCIKEGRVYETKKDNNTDIQERIAYNRSIMGKELNKGDKIPVTREYKL